MRSIFTKRIWLTAVVSLFIGITGTAWAQTTALDFTDGSPTNFGGSGVGGWTFEIVNTPVAVTSLGVWDEYADGLFEDHLVGIWASAGTLLASQNVTNANASPVGSTSIDGCWLFTPITPVILTPGSYVIGMQALNDSPDPFRIQATASTSTNVIYGSTVQTINTTSFDIPTEPVQVSNDGGFGPNFQFSVVPEATTVTLLGAALPILVGAVVFRRRTK